MKVIVDTCVWSVALRRKTTDPSSSVIITQLSELINDSLVQMIGPIRQEILSGIPSISQFNKLKERLASFENVMINQEDYELAAELYNTCRKNGIQGSNTDFLICAVAINHQFTIFTIDNDFTHFATCLPISLLPGFGHHRSY